MALATRPKPSVHHKKRQAQHHRQSKHYLKAYWPYLPMLLIVGSGLLVSSAWSNKQHVLGAQSDLTANSLLSYTNSQRLRDNEQSLTLNAELNAAAQAKAQDMVKNNYWSHTAPDGRTAWSFITASGYNYQTAGENLAYGFSGAQSVIAGWMNSTEHRANMLNASYQNVGFGVASSPNYQGHGPETVIVAEYATPAVSTSPVTTTSLNTSSPDQLVSRIQVLTSGHAGWSLYVLSALSGAALVLLVLHYGFKLKRLVFQGEAFVAHHPLLDTAIVLFITAGFVLTRTSGIIR